MLENIACIYAEKSNMLKKLKKKPYEAYMKKFREQYGHYFDEMISYVSTAEDKELACSQIADKLADEVLNEFGKNGKVKGWMQADINFFTVYYVMPAILLTEDENAEMICQAITQKWAKTFKDSNIGYLPYQDIYDSFNEKIFGIF